MNLVVCFLIYTIVSVLFSIRVVENEQRDDHWYDVPLAIPAWIIAYTWMWVDYIFGVEE